MKARVYIIFILSALPVLWSCESWIEEKNYVKFTQDKSFETEEGVMANLYGLYSQLNSSQLYGGGTLRSLADNASDCYRNANGVNEWSGYNFSATSNQVRNWWRGNYSLINAANALIENIDLYDNGIEEADKLKIKAEAKFFRALGYFNLVIAYGRVPLVLHNATDVSDVTYPSRAPLSELYALMISDLEDGVRFLDIKSGIQSGRITRGSAAGLLAKVYLTKAYSEDAKESSDFQKAVDYCENIISGYYGSYGLLPEYGDIFSPENEGNSELLFYVTFDLLPNTPSTIIKAYSPASYYPIVSSGAPFAPYTLINSYDQEYDKRFGYGFMDRHPETGAWLMDDHRTFFCKFKDDNKTESGEDRCDFPVLRYSDILLMHSEAMYSGVGVVSHNGLDKYYGINKVRERARKDGAPAECNIAPLDDTNWSGDFIDVILQERAKELNCEGHRRWDLLRTGKLEEVMTSYFAQEGNDQLAACSIRPEHVLYPMPQQEIDTNPNLVPPGETNNGYLISSGGDIDDQ